MNRTLGIYSKRKKLEKTVFQDVISLAWDGKNNIEKEFYSDDVFILYNLSDSNDFFLEDTNSIYTYIGFAHASFYPQTGICNEKQILDYAANQIKNQVYDSLKGKYNFIYYNKSLQSLQIFNDRYGFYPLYTYEDENYFLFCNDYEPLVKFNNNKYKINREALWEYILMGAPAEGKTFFADINLFPAGVLKTIQGKVTTQKSIFKDIKLTQSNTDLDAVAYLYFNTFKEELSSILEWHSHLDICLTGGTDTRMILGSMNKQEQKKRQFITWSSDYVTDDENQDIQIAMQLSDAFELKHRTERNPLYAINVVNNSYFNTLRNNTKQAISGFLGSETLRFSPSYPTNISYYSRALINSKYSYDHFNDFRLNFEYHTNAKKIYDLIVKHFSPYFINEAASHKKMAKIIQTTLEKTEAPFNEIPYTTFYLCKSFFSRHNGGARSSMFMPANTLRYLLSPFFSENLLHIIWCIHPSKLNSFKEGLTNAIFSTYFKDYCHIKSNSILCDFNDTAIKKHTSGKHTIHHINLNYDNIIDVFNNEYIIDLKVFNMKNIKKDFFNNNRKDAHVFYDLLLWLNYISTL